MKEKGEKPKKAKVEPDPESTMRRRLPEQRKRPRLNKVQMDFMGELSHGTRVVCELFQFIKNNYLELSQAEVFLQGVSWVKFFRENEWIKISEQPLQPTQVKDWGQLDNFLRQHEDVLSRGQHCEAAPSLDITEKGEAELFR
jgi:hypothetical protein